MHICILFVQLNNLFTIGFLFDYLCWFSKEEKRKKKKKKKKTKSICTFFLVVGRLNKSSEIKFDP